MFHRQLSARCLSRAGLSGLVQQTQLRRVPEDHMKSYEIHIFFYMTKSFIHDELKKGAKAMQVILCQNNMKTDCFFAAKVNTKTDKERWLFWICDRLKFGWSLPLGVSVELAAAETPNPLDFAKHWDCQTSVSNKFKTQLLFLCSKLTGLAACGPAAH